MTDLAQLGFRLRDRRLLTVLAVLVVIFAALSVVAFVHPATRRVTLREPYTQRVSFGYHAQAKSGPIYPNGVVGTGAPIYLSLVHRVTLTVKYALTSAAPQSLHGSVRIVGKLTNSSGWSQILPLGSLTQFSGDHADASATIDLSRLESLTNRVTAQIGGGSYTLAVVPSIRVTGEIGGKPVASAYAPRLDLELGQAQAMDGASVIAPAAVPGSGRQSLIRSATDDIIASGTAANRVAGIRVRTARWLVLIGLLLFSLLALLAGRRDLRTDSDPAEKISNRYGHLMVPIAAVAFRPENALIDVSSIGDLVQLAERGDRLILHGHQQDMDSYLLDDHGTWYRYREPRTADATGNGTLDEPMPGDAGAGDAGGAAVSDNGATVGDAGATVSDDGAAVGDATPEPIVGDLPPASAGDAAHSVTGQIQERPPGPADPDLNVLDAYQVEALLSAVPDDLLGRVERAMYLTAAMTGMRRGEIQALRWRDVDFGEDLGEGWINVRRDLVSGDYGTRKSKRAPRTVPLASRVALDLALFSRQTRWNQDDGLVFAHPETGKPIERSELRKRFKAAARAAELRKVRFGDLRHVFGTEMAAQGVPIPRVQEMMGHPDAEMAGLYARYASREHQVEVVVPPTHPVAPPTHPVAPPTHPVAPPTNSALAPPNPVAPVGESGAEAPPSEPTDASPAPAAAEADVRPRLIRGIFGEPAEEVRSIDLVYIR